MSFEFAPGLVVTTVAPAVPVVRAVPPGSSVTVVPLIGPQGPPGTPGASGVSSYTHTQLAAADVWTIAHGLGFHPAGIVAKDSVGDVIEPGGIEFVDTSTVRLFFTGRAVSGTADLS